MSEDSPAENELQDATHDSDEPSLETWLRERTGSWIARPPTHCLSERYQPIVPRAYPHPGLPQFVFGIPNREKAGWPTGPDVVDMERMMQLYGERDEMRIQLILETHNEFASQLYSDDADEVDTDEAHIYLLDREEAMKGRAETMAKQIDEMFAAERPETRESTNILDEALRLYFKFADLLKQSADMPLGDALSSQTEVREWHITSDVSPSAAAASTLTGHEDFSLLHPLRARKERACLNVHAMGYDCGLEYLPAEATVEQLFAFIGFYFRDIEEQADYFGNTHALLCYRLQVLQSVLREYDLYSQVEVWAREQAEKQAKLQENPALTGYSYSAVDMDFRLQKVQEYVTAPKNRKRAWHGYGEPNASRIYDHLNTSTSESPSEPDLEKALRKRDGDVVSKQAFRNWLNALPQWLLERWSEQADLSRPR